MKSPSLWTEFLDFHHPDKENIPFSTKPNKNLLALTEKRKIDSKTLKNPLQPISLNGLKRRREEMEEPKLPQKPPKTIKFYKEILEKNPFCDLCTSEILSNSTKQSPCSHNFCNECSTDFLASAGKCPLCSKKVKSSKLSGEVAFDCRIKEAMMPAWGISSSLKEFRAPRLIHNRAEKERIFYNDGSIYEGDYKNGKREGKGVLTLKTGEVYKSEWIDDIMKPIVEIIDPNSGKTYKGEVQGLQKHGKGVFSCDDFLSDGNWMNGKKCGTGILRYKDGSIFEGEWFEDQVLGFATLTRINGDVYKGEWTDLYRGSGIIDFTNGDEFIGSWWLAGSEENKEIMVIKNGSHKEKGKSLNKEEEKSYEGERDGVLMMANGVSIKGKWRDEKIQVSIPVDF